MEKRRLGPDGPEVSALGLGCFGMSNAYGARDEAESIKTIHRAIELGCNFLDTADEYGLGHNERLLAKAIRGRRNEVFLATKFGFVWNDQGVVTGVNGRPDYVAPACEASLSRLQTEWIDLYYLHRIDPNTPIEDTVGAMAELVRRGQVRYIGLSEASAEDIRRASTVHPITALQSEYSLWTREPEREIIPICAQLGIGFVAFSPLGRGFFTGELQRASLGDNDFRQTLPRFQTVNFENNRALLSHIEEIAREKKCLPAQLALAWVLAGGAHVTAIPGTTRVRHFEQNLGALELRLSETDLARIDAAAPPDSFSGARYPEKSPFNPES